MTTLPVTIPFVDEYVDDIPQPKNAPFFGPFGSSVRRERERDPEKRPCFWVGGEGVVYGKDGRGR